MYVSFGPKHIRNEHKLHPHNALPSQRVSTIPFLQLTELLRSRIGGIVLLVSAIPLHILLVRPILRILKVRVHVSLRLLPSDALIGHVFVHRLLVFGGVDESDEEWLRTGTDQGSKGGVGTLEVGI